VGARYLFRASATAAVKATTGNLWALWVDVNGWPSWNTAVKSTRLNGNFKTGKTFDVCGKTGAEAVVTITQVSQGESFTDECVLAFGVKRDHHEMRSAGGILVVTHGIEAEVDPDLVGTFGAEIWPAMQASLPESLSELVDLAAD
jgi:hypothetical protein